VDIRFCIISRALEVTKIFLLFYMCHFAMGLTHHRRRSSAACCKAYDKINGKIENSTPCKIVTQEDFNLKLGTRDYVADITHHATLGSNRPSGDVPPNRGNITPV